MEKQHIASVAEGSPAADAGIAAGMELISIDKEPIRDMIDYTFLTARSRLVVLALDDKGRIRRYKIYKDEEEPLGLGFSTGLMSTMRTCKNRCVFCFIDQMPTGTRTSLHIKDDDWRMSFVMGNYVSLTNVDEAEFRRILARRVSPLYVSVHTTDPDLRVAMMRNPTARDLMNRLCRLRDAGLAFHTQIVLCPGLNDGTHLDRTLSDLVELAPFCRSVAIVPVGLTGHRAGLFTLSGFDTAGSRGVIDGVARFQFAYRSKTGEDGIFLSDEWYLNAGMPLPAYETYGAFDQIENGVGLLRRFEHDFLCTLSQKQPRAHTVCVDMIGGVAAYPFFAELYHRLEDYGISVCLHPVENRFFGGNVHVAGLVTGQDIITSLNEQPLKSRILYLPHNMLRECEDVFLDDMPLSALRDRLRVATRVFSDGEDLIQQLFGE